LSQTADFRKEQAAVNFATCYANTPRQNYDICTTSTCTKSLSI